ncbi:hypothetical protein [Butyrivibrio sp. YAB3001]|uniref:hypothetical protein n=1 Tax=Butyrivibrio sp. YAB3001 TaxID=1520812 RepID=UPI0008F66A57|nr:hypothetical protein [Butyrivibrio sp. YAB3001]SFC69964.1 hypothetical protein SAMN02910398_02909 [Butyrivibrio sp. YAB3001]
MASNGNVNFHETFKPDASYIASILEIADDATYSGVQEISSDTGIPQGDHSGKVDSHLLYSKYMGLINVVKKPGSIYISRTNLGEVIYNEDPGLQENLSLLICHGMLSRPIDGAPLWKSFFADVLPRYNETISKDYLLGELNQIYDGKVSTKNLSPLLNAYDDMFSSLDLVEVSGDNVIVKKAKMSKEFIFAYAYIFYSLWNEKYPDQAEITSIQMDDLHFGHIFGWGKKDEYEMLERMTEKSIIRLNRQLSPYTIYKLVTLDDLRDLLFSELF